MDARARTQAVKAELAETLLARHPAPAKGAAWAESARDAARARLLAMGGPGRRDEYWRRTDPAPLVDGAPRAAALVLDETPIFDEVDALRLIFVDGEFRADLSDDPTLDGVEIQPLQDALGADIHWAKGLFGALEAAGQDPVARPLAALNTARASEGFCVRVTGKSARPINFRYLHESETSDAVVRHLVRVESGAEVTILENGPAAARINKAMEIDVAAGATCHHVRAEGRDHDRVSASHIFARLAERSLFKSFTLTVNGRLTRNETVVEFTGDEAIGHVAGAAIGAEGFRHDDTVFVTHDAERCESRQVFKKVLKSGAQGVFQGKILVKKDAQKTDGYQISQALLLDEDARFDAKPELEIYADDVACSHGSTCGEVDEDALFYLRSRGVPEDEATALMVLAFVDEAVAEIDDEAIADVIRSRVAGWLDRRVG
ncbi:Fe-S cluster assembly protein SufD [Pikeienuella piscinae]|uniref:Fe-S cluster assembly protein SufD n=1 Tax=Pikeienuella piscinae TaxID=2748098 RepID=A0A7L5BTI2_9RHOB|nr:Fe-S cluster assembly protein SufD [Pikeienuella piscinae]QIE55340.1 Fe-S cluster assembly protein SufD [Pikeienuella piscinae]